MKIFSPTLINWLFGPPTLGHVLNIEARVEERGGITKVALASFKHSYQKFREITFYCLILLEITFN